MKRLVRRVSVNRSLPLVTHTHSNCSVPASISLCGNEISFARGARHTYQQKNELQLLVNSNTDTTFASTSCCVWGIWRRRREKWKTIHYSESWYNGMFEVSVYSRFSFSLLLPRPLRTQKFLQLKLHALKKVWKVNRIPTESKTEFSFSSSAVWFECNIQIRIYNDRCPSSTLSRCAWEPSRQSVSASITRRTYATRESVLTFQFVLLFAFPLPDADDSMSSQLLIFYGVSFHLFSVIESCFVSMWCLLPICFIITLLCRTTI